MITEMERGGFPYAGKKQRDSSPSRVFNTSQYTQDQQSSQAANNAVVAFKKTSGSQGQQMSKIKVCIRVRPLLPHERSKDEVVYYPSEGVSTGLQVSPDSLIACRASKSQTDST